MLINNKMYSPMDFGGSNHTVITMDNYEYYFLLYIDGELTIEEKNLVDQFIANHPNVQVEFDLLLNTTLTKEENNIDKNALYKNTIIDLENYESYILSNIDNELTIEEQEKLNLYLQQNPTLLKEMELLQKTKLTDSSTVFNKSLLHKSNHSALNNNNYSELLLLYIDGETTAEQNKAITTLLETDGDLQNELNLLCKTKCSEEKIVYPYKKALYKKEEKTPYIIPMFFRYAAVACFIVLFSFLIGKNYFNQKIISTTPDVVKNNDVPTNNSTANLDTNTKNTTLNNLPKLDVTKISTPLATTSINKINNKTPNNSTVKTPLNQNNIVTTNNVIRTMNNNDVANKKVLENNDVVNVKQKEVEASLEVNKINTTNTVATTATLGETKINATSAVKINIPVQYVEPNEEVTIASIDANKIDKNGSAKKLKNKVGNFLQQKIRNIENSSIAIGKYEIALAR